MTAYLQIPAQSGLPLTVTLPLTLSVDLRIGIASPLSVTLDVGQGSDISVVANLPVQPIPSPLAGLDRTDATQVATVVLQVYGEKNLAALAELSTEANQGVIANIAELGPDSPRYQSVFGGWRWEAVQGWNGTIAEVRYRHFTDSSLNSYEAHARFADMSPPEIATVVLKWENGQWAFEDINSPDLSTFEKGRQKFSLDSAAY